MQVQNETFLECEVAQNYNILKQAKSFSLQEYGHKPGVRRILLGDNTGTRVVMLQQIRFPFD
jgi:hypothetical protein